MVGLTLITRKKTIKYCLLDNAHIVGANNVVTVAVCYYYPLFIAQKRFSVDPPMPVLIIEL